MRVLMVLVLASSLITLGATALTSCGAATSLAVGWDYQDQDGDGIRNGIDADIDGDGYLNVDDPWPKDPQLPAPWW
jgi:hypothetical protein